ncbi:efflux RND transporter periplasmic adaptor subunit, partial [Inquilinus limosus]|uniref:efflux RND transporter periplasmic adaptor subunit n=1 Tax=Inquilinus limosus TaxID=171674 RepID=UPI003F5CCEC6
VVTAAKRPVAEGVTFVGRVQALNKVDLVARVEGFLQQRNYTEGQEVKAGDLLFVLEKDTYQAAVDQAQANLASARANAENAKLQADRARDLIKTQNIPQATVDEREAAEKTTAASVQQNRQPGPDLRHLPGQRPLHPGRPAADRGRTGGAEGRGGPGDPGQRVGIPA